MNGAGTAERTFCFDDAVFTYAVSEDAFPLFQRHLPIFGGALTLHYTAGTDVLCCKDGGFEAVVLGVCVDTHGELRREDIPAWLLQSAGEGIETVYRRSARFAGKYVIFFLCAGGRYLFGDATSSIQINYAVEEGPLCAASTDHLLANHCGYAVSEYSRKIREGSDASQALPGDLTMYDQVKALLPNHYLDVASRKAVRVPMEEPSPDFRGSIDAVARRSVFLIRNTVNGYRQRYELVCPLTAGYDSRVVFAFLKEAVPDLTCYTFRHPGFTESTDDIRIPAQICREYHQQHQVIPDVSASDAYFSALTAFAGPYHSRYTADLACTYLSGFQGKALINGDIIDQVGKSLIGNALSPRYGTAAYFQCKLHNFEKQTRQEIEQWIADARSVEPAEHLYDLFAIENRCGRWAAQGGTLYALASIPSLNLFNSRELISLWMSLDRECRMQKQIHHELFRQTDPELLQIPFNPSSMSDRIKSFPMLFLVSTYVKFWLQGLRRRLAGI